MAASFCSSFGKKLVAGPSGPSGNCMGTPLPDPAGAVPVRGVSNGNAQLMGWQWQATQG